MLWRAFWTRSTPLYLKAAAIFAVLYLVWPLDLIPDFPLAGWIDDVLIVPLIISWIVARLPREDGPLDDGPTIDGTARRL